MLTRARSDSMAGDKKSTSKDSDKDKNISDNMETQLVLNYLQEMEKRITAERALVDQKLLDKIENVNETLNQTLAQNSEKITALEEKQGTISSDLQDLKNEFRELKESHEKLSERYVMTVAHSRRLNLHFLGHLEDKDEDVVAKVKGFLVNRLEFEAGFVDNILVRDAHRLGTFKPTNKYPRPIIVGFIKMTERNAIFKRAFKCKNSDFSIREDLPPELVDLRNKHLDIRKEILKVNPTALVSVTSRSYLPVLLVRHQNKVQVFTNDIDMPFNSLQPSDRPPQH